MKFLVSYYSCLQNPWLGGYCPPDHISVCPLSSTEFVEPPPNKIPGYATEYNYYIKIMVSPGTVGQMVTA